MACSQFIQAVLCASFALGHGHSSQDADDASVVQNAIWKGNVAEDRDHNDGVPHITIIDLGICFPVTGVVDMVEAFIRLHADPPEAWVQLWRPGDQMGGGGHDQREWRLVHQVRVEWSPTSAGKALSFELSPAEALRPAPGDCFGWYGGASEGAVPYDDAENTADAGKLWAFGARVVKFRGGELGVAQGWAARVYSWRVRWRPLHSASLAKASLGVDGAPAATREALTPTLTLADGQTLAADGWLFGISAPVCDTMGLMEAGCSEREPSRLENFGDIDWAATLRRLCACTDGKSLVGGAAGTNSACCDPDTLDLATNVAGHPKGVVCLHGALSVLAACSAKLALRHRLPQNALSLAPGVASEELRARLQLPALVHLSSPMRITPAPRPGRGEFSVSRGGEEEWWDFEIQPSMSGDRTSTHTYRLRGDSTGATFAPFPFGSADLRWWRDATEVEIVDLFVDVLVGLIADGLPAVAFLASVLRYGVVDRPIAADVAAMPDVLLPWSARDAVQRFGAVWSSAAPSRHVVEFPRHFELGLLPDPALRALCPNDLGFAVLCPRCAHVVIHFYFPGPSSHEAPTTVVVAPPGGAFGNTWPCAWPLHLLMPPRWARGPGRLSTYTGMFFPVLPWPADSVGLLEHWRRASHEVSVAGSRMGLGACWPELSSAALRAEVPTSALGFAQLSYPSPVFDLSKFVRPHHGFYDLFDLRREHTPSGMVALADKVALKERLRAEGLPMARVLHSSYDSPEVSGTLLGLRRFAVKAAHRHHGGHGVVLVDGGVDLRTGRPISIEEIQRRVRDVWPAEPDAFSPRCVERADGGKQCVTNAPRVDSELRPAVLVEELAVTWDGREGITADEAFCFVAWGRLVMCGVMNAGGVWGGYMSRDGTPIATGRAMHAELGSRDIARAALGPPVPWPKSLYAEVAALTERTASALGADLVRVDIFPNGGRPIVAEVSLISGWLGRANLRWGELDAWLLELLGDRWLEGYGQAFGRLGETFSHMRGDP